MAFLRYKLQIWELILSAFSYYCFVLAKTQNRINKGIQVKEIIRATSEFDEPSVPPAKPIVKLATQPTRPMSTAIDKTPADKEVEVNVPLERKLLLYNADKFSDIVFKWEWIKHSLTKCYEVRNLVAVCNNLQCEHAEMLILPSSGFSIRHKCPKCNIEQMDPYTNYERVKQIEQKFPLLTRKNL